MKGSSSDRWKEGMQEVPVALLVGIRPVSFGDGKAVFGGKPTANARVAHRGRTVGMVEYDVVNAEGKTVARASSTCSVLRGEAARGR